MIATAVTVLAAVGGLGAADARATVTRDDYVGQLEEVCRPGADRTRKAMKGARGDIKAERLGVAASKFSKAARIFGGTVRTIKPVPRPEVDANKLRKWFVYLERQEDYLRKISKHLRARRSIAAQRLVARFIHNGNLANNTTLGFGFDYCSFRFSRYG